MKGVEAVMFSAVTVVFVFAGMSLAGWAGSTDLFRSTGVIAAVVSIFALAVFPKAFPLVFPNYVGAMAVNAGVLVSVWRGWV